MNKIIKGFINAINNGNVKKIAEYMSDDHTFIDSLDNKFSGKETLKAAWTAYFELFPDYKIEVLNIFEKGNTIALFGFASGTYKNIKRPGNENYWKIPAAWKADLFENKVKIWQVYADNSVRLDIIIKNNEIDLK